MLFINLYRSFKNSLFSISTGNLLFFITSKSKFDKLKLKLKLLQLKSLSNCSKNFCHSIKSFCFNL